MLRTLSAAAAAALLVTAVPGRAAPPLKFPDVLYTPASAYVAAAADAEALKRSGDDPAHYLWVSAYNRTTRAAADTDYVLTALTSNSLNFTKSRLLLPVRVNDRLFRVDLHELGIRRKDVDDLARLGSGSAPAPQPYFHTAQEYEGRTVFAVPVWVDKRKALRLVALAGTEFPVLRADWFYTFALQPPAYYRFMGNPKTLADFERLAGVAYQAAKKKRRVQLSGAVTFSEVSNRNRRLERTPTDTNYGRGCWLRSFDFFASTGKKNVLKNPLVDQADAGELIWVSPNGMLAFGLINGKEDAVEFGDPRLVNDKRTTLGDKTLYVGARCMFCHAKGTIPVEDEIRLTGEGSLAFLLADAKKAAKLKGTPRSKPTVTIDAGEDKDRAEFELHVPDGAEVLVGGRPTKSTGPSRSFFSPKLGEGGSYEFEVRAGGSTRKLEVAFLPGQRVVIDFQEDVFRDEPSPEADRVFDHYFGEQFNRLLAADSENYLAAARACTGLDGAAVALKLQAAMRGYLDEPLTLEGMAIEYGYHPEVVLRLVEDVSRVANLDPVHSQMLKRRKARRDHFEESFGQVMQLLVLVPEAKP
jgi:uncharacterized protein (TIGR03000 family)